MREFLLTRVHQVLFVSVDLEESINCATSPWQKHVNLGH